MSVWRYSQQTWLAILKLLLLVVINHDVSLDRDQLLLIKLPEVEQGQLVKLLVAEQHLHKQTKTNDVCGGFLHSIFKYLQSDLHVFLLHGLVVRGVLCEMSVGGTQVVDVACASLHAGGVLHQIGLLAGRQS